MEFQFLGGASKIGSLGVILKDNGHKVLFDYGITPSDPPAYPLPVPPGVEYCFLTHAHLDHAGMTPVATRTGRTPLVTTTLTKEVAELLLYDALKVAKAEGYPEPYTMADVRHLKDGTIGIDRKGSFEAHGVQVDLTPAGHIPGASMFRYRASKDVLFTGDLNSIATRLVDSARPLTCDVLVMESTYAGKEHPDRRETEAKFRRAIEEVVEDGGQVIVPAFAVGRSQEVILSLARSGYEIWVDGMARTVNEIYAGMPAYLKDAGAFRRALNDVNMVEEPYQRKHVLRNAEVIVTTGGMLDGGPVLFYLKTLQRDPRNAIFLTGYQVEGSNGRRLLEEGSLDVDGEILRPTCRVERFDFSSHAGHSGLVQLARDTQAKTVVLVHGDHRELLAEELAPEFNVIIPQDGETLTI